MSKEVESKVDGEYSQEKQIELENLLAKIERGIVNSITRGIDIVDDFEKRTDIFMEAGEAEIDLGASLSKAVISEKATTNLVKPLFASTKIKRDTAWEVSNPITLPGRGFMSQNNLGVELDIGLYQIQFAGSGFGKSGNGLGIFDPESRKIDTILDWNTNDTYKSEGSRYINLSTPKIVGIIDGTGHLESNARETYVISIYKVLNKVLP